MFADRRMHRVLELSQLAVELYTPKVEAALSVEMGSIKVVPAHSYFIFTMIRPPTWLLRLLYRYDVAPLMFVGTRNINTIYAHVDPAANAMLTLEFINYGIMHELVHLAHFRINPDLHTDKTSLSQECLKEGFAESIALDHLAGSYTMPMISYLEKRRNILLAIAGRDLAIASRERAPMPRSFPHAAGYRFFRAISESQQGELNGVPSLERIIEVAKSPDIPLAQILRPSLYMEAHGLSSG